MQSKGLSVPSYWDHSDDPDESIPVKFATGSNGRKRLPQNAVGYLHDMTLTPDGSAAEITLDIRGKTNIAQVDENLAYVSPVIRTKPWTDGDGEVWEDIFGRMDLVQHPVDHRQTPFERVPEDSSEAVACALRMGLDDGNPQLYRLQGDEMPEDDPKPAASDNDDGGESDTVENDGGRLKAVIEALGKMRIVLSDDTNEENFLEHLEQALLTAQAQSGEEPMNPESEGDLEVATPELAMLSLDQQRQKKFIDKQHRLGLAARLTALVESGRCTPAEVKQHEPGVKVARLSLDDNGDPKKESVEAWIESREAVPRGTFWPTDQRLRMSGVEVAPHPTADDNVTEEQADEIVDEIFGKK
jgi:hypothetical protein